MVEQPYRPGNYDIQIEAVETLEALAPNVANAIDIVIPPVKSQTLTGLLEENIMSREEAVKAAEKAATPHGKEKPQYIKPVDLYLTFADMEQNVNIRVHSRKKCLLSRHLLNALDDMEIKYSVLTK